MDGAAGNAQAVAGPPWCWRPHLQGDERQATWAALSEDVRAEVVASAPAFQPPANPDAAANAEVAAAIQPTGYEQVNALANIERVKELVDSDPALKTRVERLLIISKDVPAAATQLAAELGVNLHTPQEGTHPMYLFGAALGTWTVV